MLDRLPDHITALCTATLMPDSRLSAYFPHVPLSHWQNRGPHPRSLVAKLRNSLSPLRGPPPQLLPVAFEYDGRTFTADDTRSSMDGVPGSFMATEVWPTSETADALYQYQLQSMVVFYEGHYVAVLQKGQEWFLADDRIVTRFSSLERLRKEKVSAVVPWSPGRTAGSLTGRSHY